MKGTSKKILKKFITALALIVVLFTACPKTAYCFTWEDVIAFPAGMFYSLEVGVLRFLNNMFTIPKYSLKENVTIGTNTTVKVLDVKFTTENIIKRKISIIRC